MFLFSSIFEPQRSYKHGPYSTNSVYLLRNEGARERERERERKREKKREGERREREGGERGGEKEGEREGEREREKYTKFGPVNVFSAVLSPLGTN